MVPGLHHSTLPSPEERGFLTHCLLQGVCVFYIHKTSILGEDSDWSAVGHMLFPGSLAALRSGS